MMALSAKRNRWEGRSACFKAFVMLAAASILMTTACSDQRKGTPLSEFKLANEREVMLRASMDQLYRIAGGLRLASRINGQFPAQFNPREIVAAPDFLVAPRDLLAHNPEMPLGFGAWPVDNQWNWAITNCSYAYVSGQTEADATNILLYEKPKPRKNELAVYFMDGKIKLASADQLTGLLKKQQDTGKLTDADRQPLAEPPPKMD
jgi:hypothetical protein